MTVRRLATEQPNDFTFTPENFAWAKAEMAKYPTGRERSAVIALLWKAQKQNDNWLCEPAIRTVANLLEVSYVRVLEIATFYSMFNLEPVGKYFIQLCGTTPCMLCGSGRIREICLERIGPLGVVRSDGLFSWNEVECLGACSNAPVAQINDNFVEDLSSENFSALLDDLEAGKPLPIGSLQGRRRSEALPRQIAGGLDLVLPLQTASLFDGSRTGKWREAPHWQQAIADGIAPATASVIDDCEGKPATQKKSKSSSTPKLKSKDKSASDKAGGKNSDGATN